MKPRLRTAFFGYRYFFTQALCRWLAARTDLRLIIWADRIPWPHQESFLWARVPRRILHSARVKGCWRAIDQAAFYALYLLFLQRREVKRIRLLTESLKIEKDGPITEIRQIFPTQVDDPRLIDILETLRLDAIFAMCTDVYFPKQLIDAPRLGAFVWHEGITPEYRGVYSSFWALLRKDYARIGYTLLKMDRRLDGGPVYVQGPVEGADFDRDWHSYLGHKSVVDSLPHVESFLHELESNTHHPIDRARAEDNYYSYPTGTALARLAARRFLKRLRPKARGASSESHMEQERRHLG